MTDLTNLTVAQIRDGHRAGDFSAVEVAEAFSANVAGAKALNAFIDALGQRAAAQPVDTDDDPRPVIHADQADIDRACHRLLQRMRGAPRRVARRADHGGLDMRRTMRASVATDGVPLELWRRTCRRGPVRLLILADVSLSVRPVAGFILRLAQTLHRVGGRCEVVAFVDRPVLVKLGGGNEVERLGFITQTDLSHIGVGEAKVAVYLPHAFNWSGNLYIVPMANVTPIDARAADVMKFVVSGGVSHVDDDA